MSFIKTGKTQTLGVIPPKPDKNVKPREDKKPVKPATGK